MDGHAPTSSIPVNSEDVAVPFETPLFKGRFMVRVAGLPGDGAQDYFRGKKRLMQCAVQVRCGARGGVAWGGGMPRHVPDCLCQS